MPRLSDLKDELGELQTLKFISSAFTEAAAVKLKNLRSSFERNRQFYDEIGQVYQLLKESARYLNIKNKKLEAEGWKLEEKQKTLSIAVTSNLRFYGRLNLDTVDLFGKDTAQFATDRTVIGHTGIEYYTAISGGTAFTPIQFGKDFPTSQETHHFLETIKGYTKVLLYYPKFLTFLSQTVGVVDITQTPAPTLVPVEQRVEYLFEPEFEKIIDFFELQVRALLFRRAMLEAEVARTAARLLLMSSAEERSDDMIWDKKIQIHKAFSSFMNAQLLETFAGRAQWRNK